MKIRQEYWIQDGYVASVCDTSHEGVAEDTARRMLLTAIGSDFDGEYVDEEDLKEAIEELLAEKQGEWSEVVGTSPYDALFSYMSLHQEEDFHLVNAAYGVTPDLRLWAMTKLGWKTVRSNSVETWSLKPEDMKVIRRGLEEICDIEGISPEEESEYEIAIVVGETEQRYVVELKEILSGNFDVALVRAGYQFDPPKVCAAVAAMDKQLEHPVYAGKNGE